MNKQIERTLGFLLNKGTQALHRQLNRNFNSKGFDITYEQWSILIYLYHSDKKSQQEIAEKTFKDKVSVTKIIDNLEKRSLVFRLPDENDRRIKRVLLTENGKKLVPELKSIAYNTIKNGFENVNNNDLEIFQKVLSELVKNLTGDDLLKFIKNNKGRWK